MKPYQTVSLWILLMLSLTSCGGAGTDSASSSASNLSPVLTLPPTADSGFDVGNESLEVVAYIEAERCVEADWYYFDASAARFQLSQIASEFEDPEAMRQFEFMNWMADFQNLFRTRLGFSRGIERTFPQLPSVEEGTNTCIVYASISAESEDFRGNGQENIPFSNSSWEFGIKIPSEVRCIPDPTCGTLPQTL